MLLLLVNTIAAPLSLWGRRRSPWSLGAKTSPPPPGASYLPHALETWTRGPLREGKQQTFERALDWGGGARRGGTPAGGLWCPLAWALWTKGRRCLPLLSARDLAFFILGRSGLETSTPRPGSPPPPPPAPTSRTERFRWAKVDLRRAAGAAPSCESVPELQSLGRGGRTPVLYPS